MFEANPCFTYLPGELTQIYTILTSGGWKLVFAALAGARVAAYYCGKTQYREAQELASAAIVASILVVTVAVSESRVPSVVRHILACNAPDTPSPPSRIAASEMPPAGR